MRERWVKDELVPGGIERWHFYTVGLMNGYGCFLKSWWLCGATMQDGLNANSQNTLQSPESSKNWQKKFCLKTLRYAGLIIQSNSIQCFSVYMRLYFLPYIDQYCSSMSINCFTALVLLLGGHIFVGQVYCNAFAVFFTNVDLSFYFRLAVCVGLQSLVTGF